MEFIACFYPEIVIILGFVRLETSSKTVNSHMLFRFLLLTLLFPILLTAQSSVSDSLENVLSKAKSDKERIEISRKLGLYYSGKGNYEQAIKYQIQSLDFSKKVGDKSGMAIACTNLGVIYESQGNYPEGIKVLYEGLKLYDEVGDTLNVVASYVNISLINMDQGNYKDALTHSSKALQICEKAKNKLYEGYIYNTIGLIYYYMNSYDLALVNHQKALEIRNGLGDKSTIAGSLTNIALVYYSIGNDYEEQNNWQEAIKKYKEAEVNYLKSKVIYETLKDDYGIGMSNINLGSLYSRMKNYPSARKHIEEGLSIYKRVGSKEGLKESYNALYEIDTLQKNYKDAFKHYQYYVAYRDSLVNQDNTRKTLQAQMQYDFDKKATADSLFVVEEKKIAAIKLEKEKTQRYGLILILVLVVVFTGFLFNRFKLIQKQKKVIEEQKHEVEEKHKEITDSINYAQRIQYALLASKKMLDKNLLLNGRDYFVLFMPKDVVSGDFYWAADLANSKFALVTADSTGHGVPGAIMSMLNMSCLHEAVKGAKLCEPAAILNYTRNQIITHLSNDGSAEGGKDGMDCSLVVYDFVNKKITFSAANNPVWILREKELIEYKPDKMPVGKHDKQDQAFSQTEIEYKTGDIIYTLTDGMPDQFGGPKGKKFMYKQLKELIQEISILPMNEQKNKLQESLESWKGSMEQVDDVCIIGVRV